MAKDIPRNMLCSRPSISTAELVANLYFVSTAAGNVIVAFFETYGLSSHLYLQPSVYDLVLTAESLDARTILH